MVHKGVFHSDLIKSGDLVSPVRLLQFIFTVQDMPGIRNNIVCHSENVLAVGVKFLQKLSYDLSADFHLVKEFGL